MPDRKANRKSGYIKHIKTNKELSPGVDCEFCPLKEELNRLIDKLREIEGSHTREYTVDDWPHAIAVPGGAW